MCDVFISYSSKDQKIAEAVLNALESRRIKCWIAYRDEVVGDEYAAGIVRAIKACKVMVLIYSSNSNSSRQVLNEVNSATNAEKPILPFRIDDFLPTDSFEYYLGKTHWMDAITPPMQRHIDLLCQKVGKLIEENGGQAVKSMSTAPNGGVSSCRTATYEELIALGYTAASIAMQLVENDYINCNGIGEENEGTAEQWEAILRDFNDNVIYLLNENNQIIGDFNMIALPESLIQKAKAGEFLEGELSYSDVEFTGFPGEYHGYILAASILPDYRSTRNTMLLLNAWVQHLERLSDEGVFFRDWCINVFSRDVETLMQGMGFRYVCDNIKFGKIYTLDFLPLPSIRFFRQHTKLVSNYEEYFNQTL